MSSLATLENPDIARIHDFWYNRPAKDWFAHADPDAFDAECNNKFGDLVQDARAEKLDHWQSSKDGSLALIILLDQFTRMIFRGTPDAFSSDPKALDLATRSIANGWDKQGTVTEALTFYLPLMHNESLLAQIACWSLLEQLSKRCSSPEDKAFIDKGTASSAKQHLDIIQRFGRYPSRNDILGRKSTEAELDFLRNNPGGFAPNPPEATATL